jgi:hypothetical protein
VGRKEEESPGRLSDFCPARLDGWAITEQVGEGRPRVWFAMDGVGMGVCGPDVQGHWQWAWALASCYQRCGYISSLGEGVQQ